MDLNGNAWDGVSRQAGPPCGKCEGVASLLQKQPCQVDQKNIVAVHHEVLVFFSESAKLLLKWSTVYEKIGRGFWRLNTCFTLPYMSHHESRLEGLHRILNAGDWRQIVGVPRENGVVSPRDARFVWGNTVELRLKTLSKSWRSPVGHWIRPRGRRSGLRSRFGVETKGNSFRKSQVGKERIGVIGDIWRLKSGRIGRIGSQNPSFSKEDPWGLWGWWLGCQVHQLHHSTTFSPRRTKWLSPRTKRWDLQGRFEPTVIGVSNSGVCDVFENNDPLQGSTWKLGNGCNVINSVKCGLESQNRDRKTSTVY